MLSEKESPTYLDDGMRRYVFNWLLSARYWLGLMVGISGKSFDIFCHELQFLWYTSWGIRVSITPVNDHSPYYEMFKNASYEFSSRVFEFRIPNDRVEKLDSEFLKVVSEVEYLIEHFFPGIQRTNTWAVCNELKSDDCSGKGGFISLCYVIGEERICEKCLNSRKEKEAKGFEGFVYLIGNHEQKIYKIGLSRQPKERYKAFGTKLPFKVEILHQIETTDMKKAEKILHEWMKDKNTHGEWFSLSQNDVEFIYRLTTFEKDTFVDNLGNAVLEYPK